jgi:cyclic pyranopterin monophosphate synthase
MKELTHTDPSGKARMVDIGDKDNMHRYAKASGKITLSPSTIQLVKDNAIKKGDVLTVAEIAGIQAAKQTAMLIPLCHSINTDKIKVTTHLKDDGIQVECEVSCYGKTGVEMEALTGTSIALLTIYDMCKAVDKNMSLQDIRLVEKIKQ